MAEEMELLGVRIDSPARTPVMLLRELGGDRRMLSIHIGHPEAQAIHFALEGLESRRPLTHDLITILLDELGASLDQIVISALRDQIFYADLGLVASGDRHVVSARPSDAIAIAVRTGTPIFAEDAVLAEAGYVEEPSLEELIEEGGDSDEVVEQFKEFIDQVNPEDFAS